MPQRDYRIYAHGAARGYVTGEDRDEAKQRGHGGKRGGIAGADGKQEAGHQAGKSEGSHDSDDNPGERDFPSLAQDQAKNVRGLRSERHAHANFVGTLRDGIRNHAIDADGREDHGERAEESEEQQREPRRGDTVAEDLVHSGDGEDRLIFVHGGHHAADLRGQRGRIEPGFHDQIHVVIYVLPQRVIDFETRGVRQSVHFRVVNDADDGDPLRRVLGSGIEPTPHESFADGVLVGPILPREFFVHQGDEGSGFVVGAGECPAALKHHSERANIVGTDRVDIRMRKASRLRERHALDRDVRAAVTIGEGNMISQRGAFHARQSADAIEYLPPKTDHSGIFGDFKWEGICFRILDTSFRFCLRDTPSLLAHGF